MWRNRVALVHPDGTLNIWSDVPAHHQMYEVPASAVSGRHVADLVRMLVDAAQFGWAETGSGGLGPEITGLRPPFPVSASPMHTPDSGMWPVWSASRNPGRSVADSV
jgi:hypothetical protein